MSIITLRAEIIVLGYQIELIEREMITLRLAEVVSSVDHADRRSALQGEYITACKMFDLASDLYQELLPV